MAPERIPVVSVPEDHTRLVALVLQRSFSEIQAADRCKAHGTFVTVCIRVDRMQQPRRVIGVDVCYLTMAEIEAQDTEAAPEIGEGFRLAEQAGGRSALFVIQDLKRSAVMVRSIDAPPWPTAAQPRSHHAS